MHHQLSSGKELTNKWQHLFLNKGMSVKVGGSEKVASVDGPVKPVCDSGKVELALVHDDHGVMMAMMTLVSR